MYYLPNEILLYIYKKLHRFTYLNNLLLVNKSISKLCKIIYQFHLYKLSNCFNTNINFIYLTLSKNVFYSRILNTKKINKKILTLPFTNLIKILILFNEYISYKSNKLKIITYEQLNQIEDLQYNYIPFAIIYSSKFLIFIEFLCYENKYRLKIKTLLNITNVSYYKHVDEKDIINILIFKDITKIKL